MCTICQLGGYSSSNHSNGAEYGSGSFAALKAIGVLGAIEKLSTSWSHEASPSPISWGGSTINYRILGSAIGGPEAGGFEAMSAVKAAVARNAFELWDDLIKSNIQEGQGGITIGQSGTTSGGGTYTSYEFQYDGISGGHDRFTKAAIWLNTGWSTQNDDGDFAYGSYGTMTYMHEIGHALGLSHPGKYNAANGSQITYQGSASYAEDTRQFSLMSYFDAGSDGSATNHRGADGEMNYAQTPMLYDIAAIQKLYGADMTTRSGDTTYGFGAVGFAGHEEVFDFTRNAEPILTIWDGGGKDMLDVSGFSNNSVIDLGEGTWSSVAGMVNNIAIAFGATIENARGGAAGETIYGNAAANQLFGGAGADRLYGHDGDDVLFGGNDDAADYLEGGNGNDQLFAGAGDDELHGGAGNDFLGGGTGSDKVWGDDGNDTIFGGAVPGDDHLDGGAGDDVVWAGGGNDALYGQDGNDLLGAASGDDLVDAGNGNDTLYGGAGNDTLRAGAGADMVYGGAGDDLVDLGGNDGAVDTFVFAPGQGSDTITGFEIGKDDIDLTAFDLDVGAIMGKLANVAEGVLLTLADDAKLLFAGLTVDKLSAGDFIA